MGQIIIDLPKRIRKHFRLDDEKTASEILESLEAKGELVEKTNRLTEEDLEDIRGARAAKKEMMETGESYTTEEIRAMLNL